MTPTWCKKGISHSDFMTKSARNNFFYILVVHVRTGVRAYMDVTFLICSAKKRG